MDNDCFKSCELATYEYIDNAIHNKWNEAEDTIEFLNSFAPEEVIAIACCLAQCGDSEFFTCYDVNGLNAANVLSDYIRLWMIENLKCGDFDDFEFLFCVLYNIREARKAFEF